MLRSLLQGGKNPREHGQDSVQSVPTDERTQHLIRSIVIAAVVVALVVVGIAGFALYTEYRANIEATEQRAESSVAVFSEHVKLAVGGLDGVMQAIADKIRADDFSEESFHTSLIRMKAEQPILRVLLSVDEHGQIINESRDPYQARGTNVADRMYFRAHLDPDVRGVYIGPPVVSRIDGKWAMPISRAARDEDGSFRGVAVASIDPYYFDKAFSSMALGTDYTGFLIHNNGTILAVFPYDDTRIGKSIADSELFSRHLPTAGQGVFQERDPSDGIARIVAYRLVDPWPLIVSFSIPKKDGLAPFYRFAVIWAIVTAFVLVVIIYIAHYQIGQTLNLAEQATTLQRTTDDLRMEITERVRAEEALRESEERFRSVYSQSPIGIELYDSKGSLIDVNPECLDIFGVRSVEAVKGFKLFEDPDLSDKARRRILDGQPVKYESEFDFDIVEEMALYETTKSGKCYLDVLITPWDLRKQDQKGFLVHVQDITERKRAEEELRLHAAVMDNVAEGVYLIGLDDLLIKWTNEKFARMFGYDPGEMVGKHVDIVNAPTERTPTETRICIVDVLKETGEWHGEVRNIKCDGTHFWCSANVSLFDHPEYGKVIVSAHTDITERKQAEQELSKERTLLKAIIDKIPVLLTHYDPYTNMLYLNKEFEKIVGWKTEEVKDIDLMEKVYPDPDYRKQALEYMQKASTEWREFRVQSKSGKIINSEWSNIRLDDGTQIGIGMDITERKQAEEALKEYSEHLEELVAERTAELNGRVAEVEQLNRAMTNLLQDLQAANRNLEETTGKLEAANEELGAFAYSVSHDLRAPLRHVDGFVQLLLKREQERLDPTSSRYLNVIAESSARMDQLIDDLLAFSRTGRAEIKTRRVELNELVRKARQELAPMLEGRPIAWEIGPLPAVEADPSLLRQVWVNLLSNACKFTAPRSKARVEIGVKKPGFLEKPGFSEVTIFIRDNGVGFDPQYTHKLFGVFQRLHREDEFEGTGIGLAIVRRIIHRHGGRVWAEGELDGGATFYFTLREAKG